MKMTKSLRCIFVAACALFFAQSTFAKDRTSLGLAFGGVGFEKKLTQSATISGANVSLPYTQTVFNPDAQLRLDLPLADIKENCFVSLSLGYDFSWSGYNSSGLTLFEDDLQTVHTFTMLPELVFAKGDFRFLVGTGLSFGISNYESEIKTTSASVTEEYSQYLFSWDLELGAKYHLSEHLTVFTNFTLSMPFVCLFRDGKISDGSNSMDYDDSNTNGRASMRFIPRAGISYMF